MKTLMKNEMLKKDQVSSSLAFAGRRLDSVSLLNLNLYVLPAGPRSSRTRRTRRIQLSLGRPAVLLVSGLGLLVLGHGIPSRWRFDDHVSRFRPR